MIELVQEQQHKPVINIPTELLKRHTHKLGDLAGSSGCSAGTGRLQRDGYSHVHIQFEPKERAAKLK